MKSTNSLAIVLLVFLFITSCKKEANTPAQNLTPNTNTSKACMFKTMKVEGGTYTFFNSYDYNSEGKISKLSTYFNDIIIGGYALYDYSNNGIVDIKTYSGEDSSFQTQTIYKLGSNGYASSCIEIRVGQKNDTTIFEYNATGNLTKRINLTNGGNTIYTYTNGNLTKETRNVLGNVSPYTVTFE